MLNAPIIHAKDVLISSPVSFGGNKSGTWPFLAIIFFRLRFVCTVNALGDGEDDDQ
jgi:hypothetical protein